MMVPRTLLLIFLAGAVCALPLENKKQEDRPDDKLLDLDIYPTLKMNIQKWTDWIASQVPKPGEVAGGTMWLVAGQPGYDFGNDLVGSFFPQHEDPAQQAQKQSESGQKQSESGQKQSESGQKQGVLGQQEGVLGQQEGVLGQKEGQRGQKQGLAPKRQALSPVW